MSVVLALYAAPLRLVHVWLPDAAPRTLPLPLMVVDYHPVPLLAATAPAAVSARFDNRTIKVGYGPGCIPAAESDVGVPLPVFEGTVGAPGVPVPVVSRGLDVDPLVLETLRPGRCLSFRAGVERPSALLPTDSVVVMPPLAPGHQNSPSSGGGGGNNGSIPPSATTPGVAPTATPAVDGPTTPPPGGVLDPPTAAPDGGDETSSLASMTDLDPEPSLAALIAESPNFPRFAATMTYAVAAAIAAAYAAYTRPRRVSPLTFAPTAKR